MTNQANCKLENDTYITMYGVITADKYDKSRYHWDPKIKKVVYTRVNKNATGEKIGSAETTKGTNTVSNKSSINWKNEVKEMVERYNADVTQEEMNESVKMYEKSFKEYQQTGAMDELMRVYHEDLKKRANNGDEKAKNKLKAFESRENANITESNKSSKIKQLENKAKEKFLNGNIDYDRAVTAMEKTGLNRSDAQAMVDGWEMQKGNNGSKSNTGSSIDWMKEVQTMSDNNKANLSQDEIKEYAQMYSNAIAEYQKTGKINEDLKQLTDTLKENALNGDNHAKELYNKIAGK